jgi:hypothetical protein
VIDRARSTVRASSVVENFTSRLRTYFFLRRSLGQDYLALLQFFLNHRRLLRSEHPERVGKSPRELLTGESHPHWLDMRGFTLAAENESARKRRQTDLAENKLARRGRGSSVVLPEKGRFQTMPQMGDFLTRVD